MKVQMIAPGAYFVQSYTTQGVETNGFAEDDSDVEVVGVQAEQPEELTEAVFLRTLAKVSRRKGGKPSLGEASSQT